MPKIRFTIISEDRSHLTVRMSTCMKGDTFATNGLLKFAPDEWALFQRQLCPSARSEHGAVLEIVTPDTE